MDISEIIMNKIKESKKISFKQPSLAFAMSLEAYNTAKKNKLKLEEAYALFAMALACRSMTKINDCFNYALDAFKIFKMYDNPLDLADTLNLIGIVHFYNAMYERALENFLKALHLLEGTKNYPTMSRILNNIGEVYKEVGNHSESLIYYNKALTLCKEYNSISNTAVILANMGEIYFINENYSTSFEYYKKSYDILIVHDDITALSEVENSIGKVYFIQKEYDTARECYNNALTRLDGIGNKYFIIDVLINLAQLEALENEEIFLGHLHRAIKYGEQINARKKLSKIYKIITEFYERKEDFKLSLMFYKKYHLMEQEMETTVISQKLEIIKIELSKHFSGEELQKITKLNKQLETDIWNKNALLDTMKRTNRNLSVEVISDELTNIPNRRGVNSYLSNVWRESTIKPISSSLLMIDIDYFKRYNDYHGHLEGDTCLKKIAYCLNNVFGNGSGILGRFGGEEFVCFIKNTEFKDVSALSELLRISIEKLGLNYIWNNELCPVTISIGGIFGYTSDFNSSHDMYLIADEELYKAKNAGRNKVFLKNKNEL
ncbi:tetratricopeptide repeat-containing diguanylate cyclase [Clostridium sp.]|uniref:tetratricopeptide repeat-containing diguanylate cyclase n=1 Tax=Clostridium sp. TaxID=1506 RepID=UPI001A5DB44B|nr:tetratricopeptide repeat-containing diguanylate cyclase [Clostridium sp.]MBK5240309.1 GGDEF domain-containing protein [Clostridium sp.]